MDVADPHIIFDYDSIPDFDKQVVIAAGWKPGWSTDYCAVTLGAQKGINKIIKLSNADHVYDRDPKAHADAKPFDNLTWDQYIEMIGDVWTPGRSVPIDPVGAKLAKEKGISFVYLDGLNLENVENALNNQSFVGTTVA